MRLIYSLDALDRIVAIEGPWDEFASANGAPGLTRASVLGRSLFEYISGAETAELVALLLARARQAAVAPVPFRCDSPTRRRFLRLELRGDREGRLRCESIVEREEARPFAPLLDASAERTGEIVVLCSWCKKVRLDDGRWVEVEEAAAPLRLFADPAPQISHGVCGPCASVVRASLRPNDGGFSPTEA